jgi:SAM-dependent methyltransferase
MLTCSFSEISSRMCSPAFFPIESPADGGPNALAVLASDNKEVLHSRTNSSLIDSPYYNPLDQMISKFINKQGTRKRFCPCCGWYGEVFQGTKISAIGGLIPDRGCPNCNSLERHRKVCAMLGCAAKQHQQQNEPAAVLTARVHTDTPFRMIHFGPEKAMMGYINAYQPSIDQVGVDFFAKGYGVNYDQKKTLHADVTALQFPTNFANGIIILHVLEHIKTLETALKEIKRVLAPAGWALIEVPCVKDRATKDCRKEEDLIKCAGQRDHVWIFNCRDFQERVEKAGFNCETWLQLDSQSECFDADLRKAVLPSGVGKNVPTLFCRHDDAGLE